MSFLKRIFRNAGQDAPSKQLEIITRIIDPKKLCIGHLIVAKPFCDNPDFEKTVILVTVVNNSNIEGVILNKKKGILLCEVSSKFPSSNLEMYYGGPAKSEFVVTIHKLGGIVKSDFKVSSGLFYNRDFNAIAAMFDLNKINSNEMKLFFGVTGWGIDQFIQEVETGGWDVMQVENLDPLGETELLWDLLFPGYDFEIPYEIYPRFKANLAHPMYANEQNEDSQLLNVPVGIGPITETYNEDLILHYVADMDVAYQYVNHSFYKDFPIITSDDLYKLSISTLIKNIAPNIELRGSFDEVVMVTAGGEFESSIILMEAFMDYLHTEFCGDYIVAIPTRDLLLLCKKDNDEALAHIKEKVIGLFNNSETQGLISKGKYIKESNQQKMRLISSWFD